MAHPNEERIRKGLKAFQSQDMATLDELIADDVVWHTPGRGPFAGDWKGKEEVFGLFARLGKESGGSFNIEVHDVLANDEHAVVLIRSRGEREGKVLDQPVVQVVHVEDGRMKEVWGHPFDQYAADEFWS